MTSTFAVENPHVNQETLNPVLQKALGCLDIDLELELVRYRRHKSGKSNLGFGFFPYQNRQSIEFNSSTESQNSMGVETQSAPHNIPSYQSPSNMEQEISFKIDNENNFNYETETIGNINNPIAETTPLQIDKPSPFINLTHQQNQKTHQQPEDYLASSEQLLRSLEEEEEIEEEEIEEEKKAGLFSPLGIGIILLVLMSSATAGFFLIKNPQLVKSLGLSNILPTINQTKGQNSAVNKQPTNNNNLPPVSNINKSKLNNIPVPLTNGPNLAAGEFKKEIDLNSLSSLKPKPVNNNYVVTQPSTIPTFSGTNPPAIPQIPNRGVGNPNIVNPGQSSNLAKAVLPPSLQPGSIYNTAVIKPVPNISNVPVKPGQKPANKTAKVAPKKVYFVLTNYDSEQTFQIAKKIMGNVFVRQFPDGKKIQIASVAQKQDAQSLVQELKRQGISAWIYNPTP